MTSICADLPAWVLYEKHHFYNIVIILYKLYNPLMQFEYDPDKSATNRDKHGIDFDEALALWDDPYLIEAPANVTNEPRFLAVGMIGARHWTAVYTYRGDRVRIISVRRARKQEIDYYEGD